MTLTVVWALLLSRTSEQPSHSPDCGHSASEADANDTELYAGDQEYRLPRLSYVENEIGIMHSPESINSEQCPDAPEPHQVHHHTARTRGTGTSTCVMRAITHIDWRVRNSTMYEDHQSGSHIYELAHTCRAGPALPTPPT